METLAVRIRDSEQGARHVCSAPAGRATQRAVSTCLHRSEPAANGRGSDGNRPKLSEKGLLTPDN